VLATVVTSIHHLPVLRVKQSLFASRLRVLEAAEEGTILFSWVPVLEVPTTFQNVTSPATFPAAIGARQAMAVLPST